MTNEYLNDYLELCKATQKESSYINELSALNTFFDYVSTCMFKNITENTIIGYISYCKTNGNRANTIKHKIGAVKRYLEYAGVHGNIDVSTMVNVCKKVKGERRIQPQVNMEQVNMLIEKARGIQYKALISIQAYMGLRCSEALKLRKSDFINDMTKCIIRSPKNGNDRMVIVAGTKLHETLKRLFNQTKGDELFPNVKENTYKVYIGRLGDRLGFHATTHSLRRCYATYSQEKHVPLPALQHQLGHSSLEVTARYVGMTPRMEDDLNHMFD